MTFSNLFNNMNKLKIMVMEIQFKEIKLIIRI